MVQYVLLLPADSKLRGGASAHDSSVDDDAGPVKEVNRVSNITVKKESIVVV